MRLFFSFFIALFFSTSAMAIGEDYAFYTERLYELEKRGHIDFNEAQKRSFSLQLIDEEEKAQRKLRARGVASALRPNKVIKFINDPIVVPVEEK